MASRRFNQFFNTMHNKPVLLDCNFIVDSTNVNGLGVRDLKGAGIHEVSMMAVEAVVPPPGSPDFASSESFVVLGASTITNTGSSVVTGDLGLYPGTSLVGFPPGVVVGITHLTDAAAAAAQVDAMAVYTDLQGRAFDVDESGIDLGTLTLLPGVYKYTSTAQLTGTLVLDAAGDPNAIWIFQIGTALTTASSSVVSIINGGSANNVYWQIGSSATIGTSTTFLGNILALASITLNTSATASGKLFALTGAVTLDGNVVSSVVIPPVYIGDSPMAGVILVKLQDNYNRYFGGWASMGSPLEEPALTSVVDHMAYVISDLGTATLEQWQAVGLEVGITPAVGVAFIASASAAIGGAAEVQESSAAGSGIDHIELLGDANLTINSKAGAVMGQGNGTYLIYQCFLDTDLTAPADGTKIYMSFYLSDTRIMQQGE